MLMQRGLISLTVTVLLLSIGSEMYGADSALPAVKADVEFARVGDISLTLDAFVPDGAGPFPTCILVHGGGFTKGDKQSYIKPLFEPLSQAGFAWFTINYRLAPQHRWPACAEDVETAIRWVKSHARDYKVDVTRIAIIGESAGGHLVSYAGTRAKSDTSVAAVVPFYAPHDLELQVRHRNALGESMTALLGLTELNDDTWKRLRAVSPGSHVHKGMPPYLLIHGDKDLTVPFEQSTRFQKQMLDLGNQCDLITIPEGVHGMGSWDKLNSDYREKLIAWLNVTLTEAPGPLIKRNIAYADPAHERQVLDVYSPREAKNRPVVFWIHGGGWQAGDKTSVQLKPTVFVDKGFVFVSTNYRLLPNVDIESIIRDVAKSLGWVHKHIAEHGGDPKRIFVMGHSAGAQLAALVCTDDRYLKAEGVPFDVLQGCVPVDGDTYDVPAIIETAETRRRVHGQPQAKFGHREKFGHTPEKHRDFSAVTHVAKDKRIPPFLILHVADHPDNAAQAQRLGTVLKEAGLPITVFGAKETNHTRINADLGLPDDPATKALFEFVGEALKK